MAATRVHRGVHREDWQDTSYVDGGTIVTIDTDILLESNAALADVDVALYIDSFVGSPSVGAPACSRLVSRKLRVVFSNTAAPGNQFTWTMKIAREHSIIR